jgi:hypothetical protein
MITIAFDSAGGQCNDDPSSPYVVTMLPSPADYFMVCRETSTCRARCLPEYTAFEAALASQSTVAAPTHTVLLTQDVTSMYFSSQDLEAGRHLPPFEVDTLSELPPAVCRSICQASLEPRALEGAETARCVGVAGHTVARGVRVATRVAYYCVPRDITQSVRQDDTMRTDGYAAPHATVIDTQFATVGERAHGRLDVLLVVEQFADAASTQTVALYVPNSTSTAAQRLVLFNTTSIAAPQNEPEPTVLADLRGRRVLRVRVLPALNEGSGALVYVLLDTQSDERDESGRLRGSAARCYALRIPAFPAGPSFAADVQLMGVQRCAAEAALPARTTAVCRAQEAHTAPAQACRDELWLPTVRSGSVREVVVEHVTAHSDRPHVDDVFEYEAPASLRHSLVSTLSLDTGATVYETANGEAASARTHLSALSFRHTARGDGRGAVVDVLVARPAGSSLPWLENARLQAPAEGAGAWAAAVAPSEVVDRRVEVELDCSTANCNGCRGAEGAAAPAVARDVRGGAGLRAATLCRHEHQSAAPAVQSRPGADAGREAVQLWHGSDVGGGGRVHCAGVRDIAATRALCRCAVG